MAHSQPEGVAALDDDWSLNKLPQLFHRLIQPEEIAGMIGYLLGDESKFITKATYEITAGYSS
jgi:NAD(P)-dependent dehydrogenase (short-subunit alcohol dehydrogenase family)